VLTLSESRFLRFLTFGALYFAQGIPWGFISVGYVVFLTDQGLDNQAVGAAVGLGYLPWSFKVVWGPLIDRFPSARFGRRRPFILGAELLMGVTMLLLLFVDPKKDLTMVSAVLFLHNTFAALQDVAVDALAVDVLREDERGSANSVMWACKSFGIAVGGGAGTVLAKHLGWPALFVTITILIWAVMALALAVRERPRASAAAPGDDRAEPRLSIKELLASFSFAAPLVGVAIAMLTPLGYALLNAVQTRMLRADFKLSEEAIATLSGVVSPISGVVGALIGGVLSDKLGLRKVTAGFMVLIAASLAAFAALPDLRPSMTFLIVWTAAFQVSIGAYNAATLAFFMALSNPAVGATQFAVYMAGTNVTYAWASPLGGYMADELGLTATFAIAAAAQLVMIILLPLCDPRAAEARFRAIKGASAPVPVPVPEPAKAPGA
jgi:PAT family beta-lactamase induction signal transducer AmpG